MKTYSLTLALAALSFAPSAFAGVLQLENSAKQINNVTISKGGKMTVEGRTTSLITVGAGVRKRFSMFNVYVGELLVNDDKKYDCNGKALDSLKDLNGIAVRLTLLRSIGMTDLEKAFVDGFDNNDVNPNDAAIKAFMAAVKKGGDIPNGSVLAFTGEKLEGGSEAVTYENAAGKAVTVKGGAGFVRAIFALWLGNPGSDDGLKGLRDKLVSCQI